MCVPQAQPNRRAIFRSAVGLAMAVPFLRPESALAAVSPQDRRIRSREDWGAGLTPRGPLRAEEDVRFLLVHHTAGRTNYGPDDVVSQMRQIYSFHTGPEKGWPDVCYNFFIDRFGGVWEGRLGSSAGPVEADATGGNQGYAQLVCLLGNFHENEPGAPMMESLAWLLALLADRYEINTSPGATTTFVSRGSNKWSKGTPVEALTISGHRDMSFTACPGDFVYPLLNTSVQGRVNQLRGSSTPDDDGVPSDESVGASDVTTTSSASENAGSVLTPDPVDPDPVDASGSVDAVAATVQEGTTTNPSTTVNSTTPAVTDPPASSTTSIAAETVTGGEPSGGGSRWAPAALVAAAASAIGGGLLMRRRGRAILEQSAESDR
jgi:hypothetical protein